MPCGMVRQLGGHSVPRAAGPWVLALSGTALIEISATQECRPMGKIVAQGGAQRSLDHHCCSLAPRQQVACAPDAPDEAIKRPDSLLGLRKHRDLETDDDVRRQGADELPQRQLTVARRQALVARLVGV